MTVADFAFYVFALTVLASGLFTVVARNPVHSVLFLIAAFIGATDCSSCWGPSSWPCC